MAVLEPRNTLAACTAQGPLIALGADKAWLPRLARALVIQPVGLRASGSSSPLVFAQAAHPARWSSRKRLIQPVGLRASGSSPTQFVKPLVVDAEMMRDLVDHRDRDFVDDLILVFADLEQRLAVDGDGVGQRARVPRITFGQCHTVIQAEQVGF